MRGVIHRRGFSGLALVAGASLFFEGCVGGDGEPFDPRGAEVALYGEWDVNGVDPAGSGACAEAGLQTVELGFFDAETGEEFSGDEFRFPCEDGVYESGVAVLRAGAFEYVWRAYGADLYAPALESRRYLLVMDRSGEFILQAVDFIREPAP